MHRVIIFLILISITFVNCTTYYYHYCTNTNNGWSTFPTYCCGKYMHEKHYSSYYKDNSNKCYYHTSGNFPGKYYSSQHQAWRITNDARFVEYFGACCARHGMKYGVFKNDKKGSVYTTIKQWTDLVLDETSKVQTIVEGFKAK